MKKILSVIALAFVLFGLVACGNNEQAKTSNKTNNTTATTQKQTTTTKRTYAPRPTVPNEIDEIELLEGESYQIEFWHIWGKNKSEFLDNMIEEFQKMMLDKYEIEVTINTTSQSNYATLLDKTNKAIAGSEDAMPNIVIGYPDHFAGYKKSLALVDLDPYIDSLAYGVDRNDFLSAYMEENMQFGGTTYSLPLTKSEEVLVYNKSALDACGYKVPYDRPLTWNEIFAMWPTLKEYDEHFANFKYLLNYDSTDNMFINFARQMNAKYTTSKGELLVEDQSTVTMLTTLQTYCKNGYLSIPLNYSDTANYGSDYFQQQMMPFTIGSTAGVSYDIPTEITDEVKYIFEGGIGMVPQFDDVEGTSRSVVQQGPNVCILDAGTEEEDLIAWLFIKYITYMNMYDPDNADADEEGFVEGQDNSARFAIGTGYFPVTYKAYESDLYQEHMLVAKLYFENNYSLDGVTINGEPLTDKQIANLLYSEVAYVSYLQSGWLRYDPAFAASAKLYGSATIRGNAGSCIEKVFKDTTYDCKKALQEFVATSTIGK